jgi:integrase
MSWSEQQTIEFQAPDYLCNIIRIITESGLRVYKELMGMKKEQVDLENAMVWIPDPKTPNGIAEVPLTEMAREAFRSQIRIAGPGTWLFPSDESPTGYQKSLRKVWQCGFAKSKGAILPDLRSAVDVRDSFKRGWRGRRVGHAVAPAGRCEGVQEVLADETANEKGGTTETEQKGERGRAGF